MFKGITQEKMAEVMNWSYDKAINGGLPGSQDVDELAQEYLSKYSNQELAISKFIFWQEGKTGASGFVTGFGGAITLPVTVPADITSIIYVQLRMIATIAKMRGYDPHRDDVRSLAYICLTGSTVTDFAKKNGIVLANKIGTSAVNKISGKTLTKINQAVGFRMVTKFGQKGIFNLGKMVPVLGAVVGGGIDVASTRAIAKITKKNFVDVSNQGSLI